MKLIDRLLGAFGMAGAPFLWLETHVFTQAGMRQTSLSGLCDLLYLLGWACSMLELLRLRAAGPGPLGKSVLYAQLAFLGLACVWVSWGIAAPQAQGPVFRFLDYCWPISSGLLLLAGVLVARARVLPGWRRFVPLAAGLWLPFALVLGKVFGSSAITYYGMNGYSFGAWFCLGLVAYLGPFRHTWRRSAASALG